MPHAHIGIISSRHPITTLETRIKVKRAVRIAPASESDLVHLLGTGRHTNELRKRLETNESVVTLSPKLSGVLIDALGSIEVNRPALQSISESLHSPRKFSSTAALQEDAVQTALRAFGLGAGDRAQHVELIENHSTAIARLPVVEDAFFESPDDVPTLLSHRIPLMEDSAIEHDARNLPGFILTSSDLTGRAVFQRGGETLQVITANRRDLEQAFGVDLIYLNLTKGNVVMVQYKMLEPSPREGQPADWVYRPDQHLLDQIQKMRLFFASQAPDRLEYRLNPEVFYLKFVKRNAAMSNGGIITPVEHFERLLIDPTYKGKRSGVRISYEALSGRYLRQSAFVDLVRAGYIGAYAETTDYLDSLIDAVLRGERAVVAAVQSATART